MATKWMTVSRMIEVCRELESDGFGSCSIGVRGEYAVVDAYPSIEADDLGLPRFVDFDGEA